MLRRAPVALLAAGIVAGSAVVLSTGPAAAVTVTNEAELKAAFATDTQIDLQADIVLTDCTGGGAVERTAAVTDPVTVDGHGHTILQTCADNVFLQDGSGVFTV
jgi:putative intracellular protease/amidase